MASRLRASMRVPSRVANSKSRGSRRGHQCKERKPATRFCWVITCRNATCKAALRSPISSGRKRKAKTEAQFIDGRRRSTRKKKTRKRRKRSRNHGHKSPVADVKGTHHNFCAEREKEILNRNDCFPNVLLELNEKLQTRGIHASFTSERVRSLRVNRAWISLGESIGKRLHFETERIGAYKGQCTPHFNL